MYFKICEVPVLLVVLLVLIGKWLPIKNQEILNLGKKEVERCQPNFLFNTENINDLRNLFIREKRKTSESNYISINNVYEWLNLTIVRIWGRPLNPFPWFHEVCDYIWWLLSAMIRKQQTGRWLDSRVWLNDEIMAQGTRVYVALQGK